VRVAIVGSGPAGLMAATVLSDAGVPVTVFERRPGLGRKLLVAGSSGLNITHDLPPEEFASVYRGGEAARSFFRSRLSEFPPERWIRFIEERMGLETFLGTSGRYFVREMKASNLLKSWTAKLQEKGVAFETKAELRDFATGADGGQVVLGFETSDGAREERFRAAGLFLGGASWEDESPRWIDRFVSRGISVRPFEPSNCGYHVRWPAKLLEEATRLPVKNMEIETRLGRKAGEILITEYGVEGTPIYFVGCPGVARIDLKPTLSVEEVLRQLRPAKENLSPIRRAKRNLNLTPAGEALLFHCSSAEDRADLEKLAFRVKNIGIELKEPRPLSEAISSSGGVEFSNLTGDLMLRNHPGVFLGGEMLDWDAPTGGFLIQGCVLTGAAAAEGILTRLKTRSV